VTQIGRNFLLRYFSDPFLKQSRLDERVKKYLKKLNIDHSDSSLTDLPVVPLTKCEGEERFLPEKVDEIFFNQALKMWRGTTRTEYNNWRKERITKLRWYELQVDPIITAKTVANDNYTLPFQEPRYHHINFVQPQRQQG
jgi:hypothetical protein